MMRSRAFVPVPVLVIVIGFSHATYADTAENASITWLTDYHQGLEQSQNEQKPVLLDFYADWCGPCRLMDEQTYADPRVVKALNEFVCVKLNVDEQDKAAFAYRVQSIPRTITLNVHGEITGDIVGFTDGDVFLFFLEDAKKNARKRIQGPVVSVPRIGAPQPSKPRPVVSADTATAELLQLLSDPDANTREQARAECFRRNTPEIRAALVEALTDEYLGARIAAWHTLRKLDGRGEAEYDPWASAAEERREAAGKMQKLK